MTAAEKTRAAQKKEIDALVTKHGGSLPPERVVEFASNPRTALHSAFQWDDTEAAREYRLWQARSLIRCLVTIVECDGANVVTRAFVSLVEDRGQGEAGYRPIETVLSDDAMRAKLLDAARQDMERFQVKYGTLAELASVFVAMKRVANRTARAMRQKAEDRYGQSRRASASHAGRPVACGA